jgi:hypothetical protein
MPARDSGAPWRGSQLTRQAPAKHKGRFYAALIDTGSDIFAIRPAVAKATGALAGCISFRTGKARTGSEDAQDHAGGPAAPSCRQCALEGGTAPVTWGRGGGAMRRTAGI